MAPEPYSVRLAAWAAARALAGRAQTLERAAAAPTPPAAGASPPEVATPQPATDAWGFPLVATAALPRIYSSH